MNRPRVTLVSAPSVYRNTGTAGTGEYAPPLGILTLAALIRERYAVEIIDLDWMWWRSVDKARFCERALETICASEPDVLGFSSISGSYPTTIRLMEECSHQLPHAAVVVGGPQASVVDVATLEAFPFIDFVLRGEADDTLPLLLSAIAQGGHIGKIPGLSYRDRRRVVRNPNASPRLDLDGLPLAAYDLLPGIEQLRSLPMEIGRGCPFACRFCSTNDFFRRRFRLKSAKLAVHQMKQLKREFGVTIFDLVHDMFTVDRRKIVEFCEALIDEGMPFEWSCSARTDYVDAALLRLMRKAGCRDVFFGIETGSQRMQRVIDKNLDLDVARRVLREAGEAELLATASLIAGYPEETMEDLRETVRFFSDSLLFPHVAAEFNILIPLPETPLTTQYKDQLFLDEDWNEISENGVIQDVVDRLLIAIHPDIFPNFYAFPFFAGRGYLRQLRDFLFLGMVRCSGLLQALYRITGDLLSVFNSWRAAFGERKQAYFESHGFVRDLISFAETRFPNDASLSVMVRFYCALLQDAEAATCQPPATVKRPTAALCAGVRLISSKGDVNAVFRSLQQGTQPDPAAIERWVTLAIRPGSVNRSEILEFPPVTFAILRHAGRYTAIDDIVRDFEEQDIRIGNYTPRQIVETGIELLERKKLLRVIQPEGVSFRSDAIAKSQATEHGEKPLDERQAATAGASGIASGSPFPILG